MAKASYASAPAPLGARVELNIQSLAFGGDGVAKLQGYTVFVPFSCPGDLVLAELIEAHKTYGRARLLSVLKPGPGRVAPVCPVSGQCGGCAWQQLDYGQQLLAKQGFVREALARIGHLKGFEPAPVRPAPSPLAYRNKALVPVAPGPKLGFYASGSHSVVPLPKQGCAIQAPLANRVLQQGFALLQAHGLTPYDERKREGQVRHLLARTTKAGQEALLLLITSDPCPPAAQAWAQAVSQAIPECRSVLHNHQPGTGNVVLGAQTRLLCGEDHLIEELGGFKFRISADTFFQVNPAQTLNLWEAMLACREWSGQETVLELYCGVGTLSLPLSRKAGRVYGFESVAQAVEDARENQRLNGIGNCAFFAQDAAYAFQTVAREGIQPQVLVVDPPRKGLAPELTRTLLEKAVPELIYVSCDPASLARDLGILCGEGGYHLAKLQPLDMFPQTYHVETVAYLKR